MLSIKNYTPTEIGTAEEIRKIVEGIETFEKERSIISERVKQIYDEAKSGGFNVKALRRVVALRKKDFQQRMEEEQNVEIYLNALNGSSDKED